MHDPRRKRFLDPRLPDPGQRRGATPGTARQFLFGAKSYMSNGAASADNKHVRPSTPDNNVFVQQH
jgi:hypothetical protein